MTFTIEFYESAKGESEARDFVAGMQNKKLQAKVIGSLDVLAEKGNELREPYSKHLGDGIFELRCRVASDAVRLLYFFHEGKVVVVTNGFMKKTKRTPLREIRLAKKRRKEYLSREDERHGNA